MSNDINAPFERENRYLVLKRKDIEHYLTVRERVDLERADSIITSLRKQYGKPPRVCLVIESDWPEYEAVWKMLEARMTGESPAQQLVIGAYCIHTSKYGKRGCRVVGHDGGAVIIKRIGGGYYGVPERSLTPCSALEARNAEVNIKGKSHE